MEDEEDDASARGEPKMIENIFRPSWIKDSLGALLVVATGGLYALGVGQPVPCDCGAVADDDDEVEMIETPIDAVPQPTVPLPIRGKAPSDVRSDLPQEAHPEGEPDQLGTVVQLQLAHDPGPIGVHRLGADEELLADLPRAEPFGGEREDLLLA